jgi:hypothetical protein
VFRAATYPPQTLGQLETLGCAAIAYVADNASTTSAVVDQLGVARLAGERGSHVLGPRYPLPGRGRSQCSDTHVRGRDRHVPNVENGDASTASSFDDAADL